VDAFPAERDTIDSFLTARSVRQNVGAKMGRAALFGPLL
jgi:hypothetical protein